MMASEVFVCEVLCFIRNNFDKLTPSQLKPVLVSFYEDEELDNAKELLLKAVQRAIDDVGGDPEMPRLPKRQGVNKRKQTADDIVKLFAIIDERHLSAAVPRYTADDLTRIPFVNADSMNVITSAKKIEVLEQRMNSMEQLLTDITPQPHSHIVNSDTGDVANVSHSDVGGNNYAAMVDMQDVAADGGGAWNKVTHQRPRRVSNTTSGLTTTASAVSAARSVNSNGTVPKYVPRKVIGTRSSSDVSLKPGVSITQKAVVHIDNLDPDCTPALLTDYLLAGGVTVLTCYKSKSWLREDERDKVTAFRVCVPAALRQAIKDPQLWSEGVVIRDWRFKKPQNGGQT